MAQIGVGKGHFGSVVGYFFRSLSRSRLNKALQRINSISLFIIDRYHFSLIQFRQKTLFVLVLSLERSFNSSYLCPRGFLFGDFEGAGDFAGAGNVGATADFDRHWRIADGIN